jgi:hypothetical protein
LGVRDRWPLAIAAAVAVAGAASALHYQRLGLTLAHYDARAHLVVARRIFDSLTPGWQQVGAVWLPLPHLINAVPVQNDWLYRTGLSAIAISIASMALAAWAIAWIVQRLTGSITGGVVVAALLMLNPDVLYLQSTPMTEPLLFGTTFLAVALVMRWTDTVRATEVARYASRVETEHGDTSARSAQLQLREDRRARLSAQAGWALIAAVLTRYEAWPIMAASIGLAWIVLLRRGWTLLESWRAIRGLAMWPAWAIAAFLVNSKVSVGAWFVDSGFFVPENPSLGHPWLAWRDVWDGLVKLTGNPIPWAAVAAAAFIVWRAGRSRDHAPALVILALAACATLSWGAYFKGHPVRLRYDVPLVAAAAAIVGMGVALLPHRVRAFAGVALILVAGWDARPLDLNAPVIVEAQREKPNAIGREAVTRYLEAHWDGEPIMMSMGSLGHYMHDLSGAGFNVRDFLHEGNGEIWKAAVGHPQPFAEWIAVEEKAEGGDFLFHQGRLDARFFAGYDRVVSGGNVTLYRLRTWRRR